MSQEPYDLGELESKSAPHALEPAPYSHRGPRTSLRTALRGHTGKADLGSVLPASLSLFLPGSGQIVQGKVTLGVFFLVLTAFIGTLGWAVLVALDRLTGTLSLLGYPPAAAVWTLGVLYVAAALVHIGNVLSTAPSSTDRGASPHPVLAGAASLILPGWGQILNGNRMRAVLFLGSLWFVAALWILALPPAGPLMESVGFHLPPALKVLSAPLVRRLAPALIWALAVYDSAVSATSRR